MPCEFAGVVSESVDPRVSPLVGVGIVLFVLLWEDKVIMYIESLVIFVKGRIHSNCRGSVRGRGGNLPATIVIESGLGMTFLRSQTRLSTDPSPFS